MRIRLADVSYHYPGTKRVLFEGLNLEIGGPGLHGLFGQSGVGKTTLAKIMAALITDYQGVVEQEDSCSILYTHNQERFPGWITVKEHLRAVNVSGKPFSELLEIFGLAEAASCRFDCLSLGQQNRVNLLRYLLQTFDCLIMDESLANVDEATRHRIICTIKGLYPTGTFLYISHNVLEVAKYCRNIYILTPPRATGGPVTTIAGLDVSSPEAQVRSETQDKIGEILHAS